MQKKDINRTIILNDLDLFFHNCAKEVSLLSSYIRKVTKNSSDRETITSEFWFRLEIMKIFEMRKEMGQIKSWEPSKGYDSKTFDLWFSPTDDDEIFIELKTLGRGSIDRTVIESDLKHLARIEQDGWFIYIGYPFTKDDLTGWEQPFKDWKRDYNGDLIVNREIPITPIPNPKGGRWYLKAFIIEMRKG